MTNKVTQATNKARQLIIARVRSKLKAKRGKQGKKATQKKASLPSVMMDISIEEIDASETENTSTTPDGSLKTVKSLCHGNLIVVSSKASEALRVPLFCPLCDLPMKTQDDSNAYKTSGCCWPCDLNWRSNPQFSSGIEDFKKFIEVDDKWHSYLLKRSDELKKLVNIK